MDSAASGGLLLFCPASSYRLEAYEAAARACAVPLVVATDLPAAARVPAGVRRVDFATPEGSIATLLAETRSNGGPPFAGVLATDEKSAVLAALAATEPALCSGRYHTLAGVLAARDKRRMRVLLAGAGVAVPRFDVLRPGAPAHEITPRWPCVVKPSMLSGSQGVIRADDAEALARAVGRTRAIVERHPSELRAVEGFFDLVVEDYVEGDEVAVEALAHRGEVVPLAVFDKPDPMTGPFFEETLYVAPSRKPPAVRSAVLAVVEAAARALGLSHGPIHAELRLGAAGAVLIEIAARSIGGLCARALAPLWGEPLEALLVDNALGRSPRPLPEPVVAAGVMMIPVPRSGVLAGVEGLEHARAVPGIDGVVIAARRGDAVRALPEGASYLGFIFAHAPTPAAVENALRDAHAALAFRFKPLLGSW
jgi:biotin carboxylase